MTPPIRARYGAKNNAHTLLEWSGDGTAPSELLGLTDRPAGALAPGERWSPSLGCGPVGTWWALWWSVPDENSARAGMVVSQVALWPLSDIGDIEDLLPIIEELAGSALPRPDDDVLQKIATQLIDGTDRPFAVVGDLDLWPGVLAGIWSRLWAEARQSFRAWVALSPPQSPNPQLSPWLVGIPAEQAPKWRGYPVVMPHALEIQPSRAARWLMGNDDSEMTEVWQSYPSKDSLPSALKIVERAAHRLEEMRANQESAHAVHLLRTLEKLVPDHEPHPLKSEALQHLESNLAQATFSVVVSAANLDSEHLPSDTPLKKGISRWTTLNVPRLTSPETRQLLERLEKGQGQAWWRNGILDALTERFSVLEEPEWAKTALVWLATLPGSTVVQKLIPVSKNIESCVLAAAQQGSLLTSDALLELKAVSAQRGWSRLHAWSALNALPPDQALQAQRDFKGEPQPGLEFMLPKLEGDLLVRSAINQPEATFIAMVGKRTAQEPHLLQSLDATHPGWLTLWGSHLAAGGIPWPPVVDRNSLGRDMLETVLDGKMVPGLVSSLATGLADIAYYHPKRHELWTKLEARDSAALSKTVATRLIQDLNTSPSEPEYPLANSVLSELRRTPPTSSAALATVIGWSMAFDESEVCRWLEAVRGDTWSEISARSIGKSVQRRNWQNAAKKMASWCKTNPSIRPALDECNTLMGIWDRIQLGIGKPKKTDLITLVADIGADLAPDRLEYLWERAGGARKDLHLNGRPTDQWHDAARQAQHGKLKGGLHALVAVLSEEHPFNQKISDLLRLFAESEK